MMGAAKQVGDMMVLAGEVDSGESNCRERASAFVFFLPGK